MSVNPSAHDAARGAGVAPAAASLLRRHEVAKTALDRAFARQQRVAMLVGVDSYELGQVIGAFIDDLDDRTTTIRLRQPQENALAALGEINRAIGFDPKDLTLSDLQNVLTLFLEYQCNHHHRTVLCVEKADEQSMWLLDCIARLIQSSEASEIGRSLLVVLSGSNHLSDTLRNGAFEAIRKDAGTAIRLGPLSIFETREFLRRLSVTSGQGDIQSLFEFDAVERLHRLSGGIPHAVVKLYRECVAIERRTGAEVISSKMVSTAMHNLRADSAIDAKIAAPKPALVEKPEKAPQRRLLIEVPDKPPRQVTLQSGRFMIGRARTSEICLPSQTVSRRHALLIDTGESVQVLDLGSVNGVYADGKRIAEGKIKPGTVLTFGDCRVEYLVE